MPSRRTLTLFLLIAYSPLWPQSGDFPKAQKDQAPPEPTASPGTQAPQPPSGAPNSNAGDSTKLEVVKSQKADYPSEAAEKAIQGQVWVKILISETGDVENVEVLSGDPILAKAAVEAAEKWKFKPFIKNRQPVKVSTRLPFDFFAAISQIPTHPKGSNRKRSFYRKA